MNYSDFDLSRERIMLTGGCGFIGHHLALALKDAGADVLVADNLGHNHFASIWSDERRLEDQSRSLYMDFLGERLRLLHESGCQFKSVDSRNEKDLRQTIESFEPTRLVHMAAVSNANVSNKMPDLAFENNMVTLQNALEACRVCRIDLGQFVFFSSSMVYGDFSPGGVSEKTWPHPMEIYGAHKLAGEHIVKAYSNILDRPYTIVRPSALYGPRCVSRRVTQLFVEKAIAGEPLTIQGDGSECLDFTFVSDLVQGVVRVLDQPGALDETFNLTYGESRPIRELVEILEGYFPSLLVKYSPRDEKRPLRGTLDISKARDLIGYDPEFPLELGYRKYIEWYLETMETKELETVSFAKTA